MALDTARALQFLHSRTVPVRASDAFAVRRGARHAELRCSIVM